MQVRLPGGLPDDRGIATYAVFSEITGVLEQELSALDPASLTVCGYVDRVLELALESLGGKPADAGCISSLCVADRQFLMLKLAVMFEGDSLWLRPVCSACGKLFDLNIQRSSLPVRGSEERFPEELETGIGKVRVRVPTGADQSMLAGLSEDEAIRLLLHRCIVMVDGNPPGKDAFNGLSTEDVERIEALLEEISPAVCTTLATSCPECGALQEIEIDPYDFKRSDGITLYEDVHAIASSYHWTEEEILCLPRAKRRMYIEMIERDAGLVS